MDYLRLNQDQSIKLRPCKRGSKRPSRAPTCAHTHTHTSIFKPDAVGTKEPEMSKFCHVDYLSSYQLRDLSLRRNSYMGMKI